MAMVNYFLLFCLLSNCVIVIFSAHVYGISGYSEHKFDTARTILVVNSCLFVLLLVICILPDIFAIKTVSTFCFNYLKHLFVFLY